MSLGLHDYFQLVADEHEASIGAPLSLRRATLAAVLLNNLPDKVFAAYRATAPDKVMNALDLPEYRAHVEAACPEIRTLHALCRFDDESPRLVREAVAVPEIDTTKLALGEFMISLYNDIAVQTLLVHFADGSSARFHDVTTPALSWWKNAFAKNGL